MQARGETALFWRDLSAAGLIEGTFSTANATTFPASDVTLSSTPNIDAYLPQAKIGNGNYIYAWSGYYFGTTAVPPLDTSKNYFGLSAAYSMASADGKLRSNKGLTVQQAYNIDSKIDDGLPYSGRVLTLHIHVDPTWLDGNNAYYNNPSVGAVAASTTTCTDNAGIAGTQNYSIRTNGGNGINCALSFRFR